MGRVAQPCSTNKSNITHLDVDNGVYPTVQVLKGEKLIYDKIPTWSIRLNQAMFRIF